MKIYPLEIFSFGKLTEVYRCCKISERLVKKYHLKFILVKLNLREETYKFL